MSISSLFFSNRGAALAEINLALKDKNNSSVINPVEFDSIIEKRYPENSYFPQSSYYTSDNVKHEKGKLGGYYPLLRRSLYDANHKIASYVKPKYYALNIGGDEALANLKYKVVKFEKNLIQFEGSYKNTTIVKTFTLDDNYTFNLKVEISNGENLWLLSGVPEVELTSNSFMPELKYKNLRGTKNVIDKISLPKNVTVFSENYVDWVSNSNGFFGIIVDPLDDTRQGYKAEYILGGNIPTRLSVIDARYNLYPPAKYPGYEIGVPLPSNVSYFRVIAAPFQDHLLKALDKKYANAVTGASPDYLGVKKIKGWFSFLSEPFAKLLLIIMRLFYFITHSWGFSIILLTIVFRIMLYPLNSWSIKSTLKMQEITPLLKVIDAKYKKDPKQANLEKMKVFKEKGTNPVSGCLPVLIQLPFLLGMFNLLKSTFELRGASFIPYWIEDLSAPDVLFSWKYPIPLIGTQFHFLPIALGIVMFVQSKMNMKAPLDKSHMSDQEKQQQIMLWLMPLLFTVLFYKAASGLNIYFFFSMLLGILQQWYMTYKLKGTMLIRKK